MNATTSYREWAKGDFRARFKAVWKRLRGGDLTPARAAAAVAVGLAVGVTPLWGLHFFLLLAICVPLRLDFPVAYLAANISLPMIAPFLTAAELEIGSLVLLGHSLPKSLEAVKDQSLSVSLKEVIVGTLFFAPAVAAVGSSLTFFLVRRIQEPSRAEGRSELDLALDRVGLRYGANKKEGAFYYVRTKLAGDPVARRVAELAAEEPLGEVIDAGCGRGQLGVLLLERKLATRLSGFDWDAEKVAEATSAASGLPATFRTGDLRQPLDEKGDTALLIDVLHYLTDDEQVAVLENVARAARRTVVVRELDPDRGWRSRVTELQERVTTRLGFNRGARVNVRPIAALTKVLEAEGFECEVTPCWGGTPFANVLIVARRRTPIADAARIG